MRTLRSLTSLLITLLLTSCARAPTLPPIVIPTLRPSSLPPPSATLIPTPTSLLQPTLTPAHAAAPLAGVATRTPGLTGTPRPEARLDLHCLDILPQRPAGLISSGQLLFVTTASAAGTLDMATGRQALVTQPHEIRLSLAISPDRRQVAYRRLIYDAMRIQTLQDSLVIADAAGQPLQVRAWEPSWSAVVGWLDHERLVLNLAAGHPDERTARKPATLAVLNTTTGERKVLRADYPQIFAQYPVPNWDRWGVTVYDATLTRVVYAYDSLERFDAGYTLWDVSGGRALANVPASNLISPPRWAADGSRFAVAANTGTDADWLSFELYSASHDGTDVRRLTYLTEHYAKVFIQDYAWSPDGSSLAFWLVADPEGVPFIEHGPAQLAVLDTQTGVVTNTCVPGEHDASLAPPRVPPPLWSPDGRQIIVENSAPDGTSRVILVDLETGVAAEIARGLRPEGWMTGP